MISLSNYISESLVCEARKKVEIIQDKDIPRVFYTYKITPKTKAILNSRGIIDYNKVAQKFGYVSSRCVDIDTSTIVEHHVDMSKVDEKDWYGSSYRAAYDGADNKYINLVFGNYDHFEEDKNFINQIHIAFPKKNEKKKNYEYIEVAEDGHIINPIIVDGHCPTAVKFFLSKEEAEQAASNPEVSKGEQTQLKNFKKIAKADKKGRAQQFKDEYKEVIKKFDKMPLEHYLKYVEYVFGEEIWDVFDDPEYNDYLNSLPNDEDAVDEFADKDFWMERMNKNRTVTIEVRKPSYSFNQWGPVRHHFVIDGKPVNLQPMPGIEDKSKEALERRGIKRLSRQERKDTLDQWLKKHPVK